MDNSIWFILLLQVVLIALNAVFACAEIAVLSVNETKLERMAEQGDKRAKRLHKLTREPAKFLATIQVAITLSGFLGSAFAADNFSEPLVEWVLSLGVNIPRATLDAVAVIVITLILSYFTLVLGELVPKRVAMKRSEQLALGISGLVSGISSVFKPIVWLLTVSTNAVLRLMGIDPNEVDEEVSEEEISLMVDAATETGAIDEEEKEFIQNIFEFDDLTAEEIATHRTDLAILWIEDEMDVWAHTIHESRHTLYPVCEGSPDNVVGILNAKDYFRLEEKSRETVMAEAVRPAYFVPATVKADVLFRSMRKNSHGLAVVLDEYGGVVGIITLNDLIEELVGDLGEETPEEAISELRLEKLTDDTWSIHGNVLLEEIEQALDVELEHEEAGTLTGILFSELGIVPDDGKQTITLEYQGLRFTVTEIEEHQVAQATVTILPKPEPEEDED